MDDLGGLISSFLGKPENVEKLKSLAGLLASGNDNEQEKEPEEQPAAEKSSGPSALLGSGLSIEALQALMSGLSQSDHDDRSNLLRALKPYLSDKRAEYVDSAIKLLSLSKLISIFGDKF